MSVRPSQTSRDIREALPNVREQLGGPPRCSGAVGRPSRMPGRLSRMSESAREALMDARE